MELIKDDYLFLKGRLGDTQGSRYMEIGEGLYEAGYIDDFGMVTPKGQAAVDKYENITYALSI